MSKKRGSTPKGKSAEHKEQGEYAPAQLLRNGGDAFAYGVSKMLSDVQSKKGSATAFLGVESETLDPLAVVESKDKLLVKKGK